MPYVFDQVDQQLDSEGNKKADIFGEGQTPEGASQTGAPPKAAAVQTKTDLSGEIAPGQAGGGGNTTKAPEITAGDRQKAINIQSTKQATPKITEQLGTNVANAQTSLQDEANKYTQGYKDKDYREGVNNDVLGKAVQGDEQAYNQAFNRATKQNYGQVDEFKPATDTTFQDISDLQSRGGIQNVFRRQEGPQYSNADASYDSMLLTRNPEFRQIQQQLSQKQQALQAQDAQYRSTLPGQAQTLADTGFQNATTGIQSDLGNYQQGIENPLRQKMAEENARRQAMDYQAAARDFENQQMADIAKTYSGGPNTIEQRAAKQLGFIDPNQYMSVDKDTDWREFASGSDAAQYNRIMGLLGKTDTLNQGAGPGQAVSFNQQGLRDALWQNAMQKEHAIEDPLQAQKSAILAQKQKEAEEVTNLIRQYGGYTPFGGTTIGNQAIPGGGYTPGTYDKPLNINGADLLSAEQATQLNALAPQIGEAAQYGQSKQDLQSWIAALREIQKNQSATNDMNKSLGDSLRF